MKPRRQSSLAIALCLLGAFACKSDDSMAPERAEVSEELSVSARVTAVEPVLRLVTLQDDAGETVTVLCGPEVINFDQIQVGDVLHVRYRESLVAALVGPGEGFAPADVVAAGAAEPGAKPAAGIGEAMSTTVRVESVDKERFLVTFTPPEGGLQSVRAVRPEGQAFVKGLRPGDLVRLVYTRALALSVEEQ